MLTAPTRGGVINYWAVAAITAVVWTVMSVRSPRLQAILYGFPVPITIALLGDDRSDPSAQYVGVIVLALFFFVVAAVETRAGRLAAVLSGLTTYVAIAAVVNRWLPDSAALAFLGSSACWFTHWWATRARSHAPTSEPEAPARPGLLTWISVPVTTALTLLLGGLLGSLVVTFPYSGVPVALSSGGDRSAFAHHFAVRAGLLLVFLGVYTEADARLSVGAALALAWAVFLVATFLTTLPTRRERRRQDRARTAAA
ncbi:MAG: hypothetical protein ACXVWV_02915 [Nocardioides sp.]